MGFGGELVEATKAANCLHRLSLTSGIGVKVVPGEVAGGGSSMYLHTTSRDL